MNENYNEIIITGLIGNQQKQIIVKKRFPSDGIYDFWIDKEYLGQVIRNTNGWGVYPHEESWLKGENCDVILQAVINAETSNS